MSAQIEKLEKNMAKLTIEVPAEEFEAAIESAYQKAKGKITLPGFRKGKAPRKMIEKMYGEFFLWFFCRLFKFRSGVKAGSRPVALVYAEPPVVF